MRFSRSLSILEYLDLLIDIQFHLKKKKKGNIIGYAHRV